EARALVMHVDGYAIGGRDASGYPIVDDSFYVLFCSARRPVELRLPAVLEHGDWEVALDTTGELEGERSPVFPLVVQGPAVLVLRRPRPRSSLAPSDVPPPLRGSRGP